MAAELKIGIGADTAELQAELKKSEKHLDDFVKAIDQIGRTGQKFKTLGNQMSVGLTLPIVGFATLALKSNKEVSESFNLLSESIKSNTGRIGDVLEKNLNISGVIDKISKGIADLTDKFESLSPTFQKVIIAIGALVAGIGPLIAVVGTFMAMLPTLMAGLGALSLAFTAMTGPIGLVVIGLGALTAGYFALRDNTKKATDYQNEWAIALNKANNESSKQVSALDALYKKTQDTTLSTKLRIEAVNELQRLYPKYFNNIKDETILNGGAEKSYNSLRVAIVNASKARAAGAILDKRSGELLISQEKRKLELAQQLQRVYNLQAAQRRGDKTYKVGFEEISTGFSGTVFVDEQLKAQKAKASQLIKAYQDEYRDYVNANKSLIEIQKQGAQDIADTIAKAPDVIIPEIKKANDKLKTVQIELPNLVAIQGSMAGLDIKNPLDLIFSEEKIKDFEQRMARNIPRLITPLTDAQIAMEEQGIRFQEAVGGLIGEGVVEGLSQAFEAMGGAIAQGGSILQAAGGAILGVLGQFMQMLGKEMIKLAVATIALGNLVSGIKKFIIANPGAAIALAGVAIVAGTLLSAAGSNIGGGSSGGGSVPSGGGTSSRSYSSSFSSGGNNGGEVVFRISGRDLVGVLNKNLSRNERLNG